MRIRNTIAIRNEKPLVMEGWFINAEAFMNGFTGRFKRQREKVFIRLLSLFLCYQLYSLLTNAELGYFPIQMFLMFQAWVYGEVLVQKIGNNGIRFGHYRVFDFYPRASR